MKKIIPVLALLITSGVLAQTANVIQLEPADSARAQKAWDALQKAQAEWDAVQKETETKYIPAGVVGHCTNTLRGRCVADEWYHGSEFSKDFKAIVPKQGMTNTSVLTFNNGCGCGNCFTPNAAPATVPIFQYRSITPEIGRIQ
jgi:hypothetical protein